MKTIANNITASERLFTKVTKGFSTDLFPCEEDCEQIDMIYKYNGNEEYFTINQNLRSNDRTDHVIRIKNNEVILRECNLFLEFIEL